MNEDMCCGPSMPQERRETEVIKAFSVQKALLEELGSAVSSLNERFSPALTPSTPSTEKEKATAGFSTDLAREINGNSERIRNILDGVVSMLKRCEL